MLKDQTGYNLLKKISELNFNYLSRVCNSLFSTNHLGIVTTLSKTSCTFLSVCLPNEFLFIIVGMFFFSAAALRSGKHMVACLALKALTGYNK